MEIPAIVGGGLIVIGVGIGLGGIGRGAMEAIGRQPQAYEKKQTTNLKNAPLVKDIALAIEKVVDQLSLLHRRGGFYEFKKTNNNKQKH